MRTRTAAAIAAMLLIALTGCSGSDAKPKAEPSAKAPSATTAKPAPTLTQVGPLAFGKSLNVPDSEDGTLGTATVLGYEQGAMKAATTADEEFGTTGYVWAVLELKVCSIKGSVGITRYPWVLAYADGSRIEPSGTTYGDFPKPEYPHEARIKEGDCVRGKTVYAVPGKQRPERVLYTTELFTTPPEWAVPKA
ncbi:hypothetical protein ACFYWY_06475 [Streptomyces sp. NPDC002870]|uniref:hypothetical protein n=1 Tax=Streptomyces sp. NPDC002870 TaxID=3364666 RepID=UPI00367C784C